MKDEPGWRSARGAVELAFAVVAAADHRPYRAAMLDHDESALLDLVALAILPEARFDRFLGCLLQPHVDRRAHDQRMLREGSGNALDLFEGPVEEEIRCLDLGTIDHGGRGEAGGDHLSLRHQPALDEIAQDLVGAGTGRRQVHMGA